MATEDTGTFDHGDGSLIIILIILALKGNAYVSFMLSISSGLANSLMCQPAAVIMTFILS